MERMKFQIMAQNEGEEDPQAPFSSAVPDPADLDIESVIQAAADYTTPSESSTDHSDSTSDSQLQSNSTGYKGDSNLPDLSTLMSIFSPPTDKPNLISCRLNLPSPLKLNEKACVNDGIMMMKSNKGDVAGSSSNSRSWSSQNQSKRCHRCYNDCSGPECLRFPTIGEAFSHVAAGKKIQKGGYSSPPWIPMDPLLDEVQEAEATSSSSAQKTTDFPMSSVQAGQTSESISSFGTMNPSLNKVQASGKAIPWPSAQKPTAFPTSPLQAGQTSESSSSYGTMNPSLNKVRAAGKAISSPPAQKPTTFPTLSPQAGQTSKSSSSSYGTMNPSHSPVQAADKAISSPSAQKPTTFPTLSLQAGQTSESSISSYGRMNPSLNQVQAAKIAVSLPSAPTKTGLPVSSPPAERTSGSSLSHGIMNPSPSKVQAAEGATTMPSPPAATASPTSLRQEEEPSDDGVDAVFPCCSTEKKLPSGKELADSAFEKSSDN